MSRIARREFFSGAAGAAGAAAAIGVFGRLRAAEPPPPPQVPLGSTGITMSRVGQGTGMNGGNRQSNHTRMGFEKLVALLRHSYDRGITFFDLADLYGSHVYFREALRSIPREKVSILTKLWWRYDGDPKEVPPDYQRRSARTALERFRHEIATDHLDIVLLHCLVSPTWDSEMGAYMEVLHEAKEKKQIRALGVSCHDLRAMRRAANVPWVDVVLARINPQGVAMDGKTDEVVQVLKEIKAKGKAIIGMKIYGEGRLREPQGRVHEVRPGAGGPRLHDDRRRDAGADGRDPAARRGVPRRQGWVIPGGGAEAGTSPRLP